MVGRDKGTGKKLGAEKGEVVFHGEDLGLSVKMAYFGRLHASRGYPEGLVLEGLNFSYGCVGSIREPNGSCVGVEGADEGFKSN